MKKNTFLLLFLFGIIQFVNSQCTTTATGFGNNNSIPMYNVQGAVQVVLNANNTVTVNLMSNFSTASGPDVRIFLVDRGSLTNSQLKLPSNFLTRPRIEMGIPPASGAASYTKTIPAGINITDFETVYFYCQAFSQFWDYGSFTPFTMVNCSLLGISDFENDKLQLSPNPVTNVLNVELENSDLSYRIIIYNTLGSLVYASKDQFSNTNNSINLDELNTGVYFVQITDSENKTYLKKILKK